MKKTSYSTPGQIYIFFFSYFNKKSSYTLNWTVEYVLWFLWNTMTLREVLEIATIYVIATICKKHWTRHYFIQNTTGSIYTVSLAKIQSLPDSTITLLQTKSTLCYFRRNISLLLLKPWKKILFQVEVLHAVFFME